jgi:NhaA family Na+:H+ antiporter
LGLWVCLLKSGVHATIAGVILGMLFTVSKDEEEFKASAIYKVEHRLKPWTTFAIMPLFALANAGVSIDISHFMKYLLNPVSMGIIAGLFFGKQVGIFGMSFLLLKLKVTALPEKMTLLHLYGVSILGGIGFTMSLFITTLSFTDVTQLASAKLAILIGSVLSGVVGAVILGGSQKKSI